MSHDQRRSVSKEYDASSIDPNLGHPWTGTFVKEETHQSSESSLLAQPQGFLSGRVMRPPDHIPPSIPSNSAIKPAEAEESPIYVNAKQFHRILKRRLARQKLKEQLKSAAKQRKPYLHESRHNHAMRRPRGPGGRFLTKEELAAREHDQGHVNEVEMDGGGQ